MSISEVCQLCARNPGCQQKTPRAGRLQESGVVAARAQAAFQHGDHGPHERGSSRETEPETGQRDVRVGVHTHVEREVFRG